MAVKISEIGNLTNLESFLHREEADINHLNIAYVSIGQAGGKIGTDISRFGYYGVYINTCEQDLVDAENTLKSIYPENKDNYKIIRLEGYDGAFKDRYTGLQAVKDNKDIIESELVKDTNLSQADFVWIICSLGGGTGCGAVSAISQIVSGLIRKDKRVAQKYDRKRNLIDIGKATVGIIAAIPDNDESPKMKLNAAEALEEINVLQEKKIIGSVLLIDNEKLISDYMKDTRKKDNWKVYGNSTTASIIAELAIMTSLPGEETFDKSEIIDLWSTPGFLSVGKNRLYTDWQTKYKPIAGISNITEQIEAIVDYSFQNLGVFADGYDFSFAIHGGIAIITNKNSVINSKHKVMLRKALNKTLSTPEVIHFGIFDNHIFGTYSNLKKDTNEAIIYTLAVINKLPNRIYDMVDSALKSKRDAIKKRTIKETELRERLSDNDNLKQMDNKDNESNVLTLDLDSMLEGDLFHDVTSNDNEKDISADDTQAEFERLFKN